MLSESDLTELSSEGGDAEEKKTPKAGRKKKKDYRLRNVLKPGRTTQYTAKALYDQIQQNDIDLEPDYQRDVVWSDAKQIGLIDSIFRNFYVPPIIFSVTAEDDGTEKRVCIDGKQRLTSIEKFISGTIPHRDPFTKEKLWFVDSNSGPKRKLLPPQYKTLFQNKQIVCIEYSDLPGDLEREVFQRVQMGMALTTAEKLQAITGPWPDLVREILRQYHTGKDGIASNMNLEQTRSRDFQNIAQILFCIDHLPEQDQSTPLKLERWLQEEEGPSDTTRTKVHDVFKKYMDLANHKQLKAPFKNPSRVAPAEFIMTAVLIAVHKDTLSLSQLSQAVEILRTKTRAEHVDVRTNSRVFKTMFTIIFKDIKPSALKKAPGEELSRPITSQSAKRKRDEGSDEYPSDAGSEDAAAKYRPRSPKKQSTSASMDSQVNSKATSVLPTPIVVQANPHLMPSGSSGLDKIRAARLQVTEIINGTQPASLGIVPNGAPRSFPAQPSSLPSPVQSVTLESMIMSHSSNHLMLDPIPPQNMAPPGPVPSHNGIHIPSDKSDSRVSPDTSRYRYRENGDHRNPTHSVREEHNEGVYHGRSGHDNRRDRDHAYRDRGGDRGWNNGQDRSHSRNSYSSGGDPYYNSSKSHDRRDWGGSQRKGR